MGSIKSLESKQESKPELNESEELNETELNETFEINGRKCNVIKSQGIREIHLRCALRYIHESKTKKLDVSREVYIRNCVSATLGDVNYDGCPRYLACLK